MRYVRCRVTFWSEPGSALFMTRICLMLRHHDTDHSNVYLLSALPTVSGARDAGRELGGRAAGRGWAPTPAESAAFTSTSSKGSYLPEPKIMQIDQRKKQTTFKFSFSFHSLNQFLITNQNGPSHQLV